MRMMRSFAGKILDRCGVLNWWWKYFQKGSQWQRVSKVDQAHALMESAQSTIPVPLMDREWRCFSQTGEDGILVHVFGIIGFGNRRVVEICCGDGIECNGANLIVHHGFDGLLFDGSNRNLQKGRAFYKRCPTTWARPPRLVEAWITKDNVNRLISDHGFEGPIDLLSIDVDGVDYWLWESVTVVDARVVVVEFNNLWKAGEAKTIPYKDDFVGLSERFGTAYGGASLEALNRLAVRKGYYLAGVNSDCFNAFFVKESCRDPRLPGIRVEDALERPYAKERQGKDLDRWRAMEWVEVS